MKKIFIVVLVCLVKNGLEAANRSGSLVYVVTPAPRSQGNEARSAPFYYHNWMRRMDPPQNATAVTTSTTPKTKTPDLIFAEFESDNGDHMRKSIQKLLEKERVSKISTTTTTTTSVPPMYVSQETNKVHHEVKYTAPEHEESKNSEVDMTDYFSLYNSLYSDGHNKHVPKDPAPVYLPSTSTTTRSTITTTPTSAGVENIWHIIDSEKQDNSYSDKWEEVPLNSDSDKSKKKHDAIKSEDENNQFNENFALPGFGANSGNGAENESRAIRTEPNIRFPYVNLKPIQMKNIKKPLLDVFSNSKKSNDMFTSLDNFKGLTQPVRGEIEEIMNNMRQSIDRYNPAQPYLPQEYGSSSKQSGPTKTVGSLVPPPPAPPKITANDFPAPTNYESFPPYSPTAQKPAPSIPASSPPVSLYQPPTDALDDSGPPLDGDTGVVPMDLGYRYKPPSPPVFVPTLPPPDKPPAGYSYNKPASTNNIMPALNTGGYSYNKPMISSPSSMSAGGYSYSKPSVSFDSPIGSGGYSYSKPQEEAPPLHVDDKPDFPNLNFGDHDSGSSSFDHDSDYPEITYSKPHGGYKNGDDMKGNNIGMMPPPPPDTISDTGPPMDDHDFPPDFPGDFKFHHDFDDHEYHYHHDHTTTTTTETPRVNRFSYYYLGKKLYYLPLYFSVYFIVYVGALIIKAVLRHKIVYPNSWRPNGTTATFFSKRSVDSWDLSNENLHEVTGRVTKAIAEAAEKYVGKKIN